jgi:hypothetical protein
MNAATPITDDAKRPSIRWNMTTLRAQMGLDILRRALVWLIRIIWRATTQSGTTKRYNEFPVLRLALLLTIAWLLHFGLIPK